jgi:hypothetical protein
MELKVLFSVVFTFLNVIDVITTNRILARGGEEMNPFIRILMKFNLFIPIKIAANLFIIYLILMSSITTGIVCCLIMSVFAINNCIQLYLDNKEA